MWTVDGKTGGTETGSRVPFMVDVSRATFEQLELMLAELFESVHGLDDRLPPTQFNECLVSAVLSLLRLQVSQFNVMLFSTLFTFCSASSAVIPNVIWGGCYILKTVTPTEALSAAITVFLPSVLRGAGVQSLVHVLNRQWTMSVVLSISHSQWSVVTDKILLFFHPTARCHLCSASLSTSQVAAHPAVYID